MTHLNLLVSIFFMTHRIVVWNVKQAYILMSLDEVCEKAWRPSSKVAWNEKYIEFWCLSSFHYKCEDELPRKGRENHLDLLHFHRKIEVKKFSCAFKQGKKGFQNNRLPWLIKNINCNWIKFWLKQAVYFWLVLV